MKFISSKHSSSILKMSPCSLILIRMSSQRLSANIIKINIMSWEAQNDPLFFLHYFQDLKTSPFPPLLDRTQLYQQVSYSTPRPIHDVNFLKKYPRLALYTPYLASSRPQKVDVEHILEVIEQIYNRYKRFFVEGGWRVVKNKSLRCNLQQYLLLRLSLDASHHRACGSMDRYILGFFFTLNYLKTCNYEVKLFTQFLNADCELEMFFLFIVLRKKSRRSGHNLLVQAEFLQTIVKVLDKEASDLKVDANEEEGESFTTLRQSQSSIPQEVKLLVSYYSLVEYIVTHGIVLHEVMVFNLMKCAGVIQEHLSIIQYGKINWKEFMEEYFGEVCAGTSYKHLLIADIIDKNLKIGDSISQGKRQEYLEESFSWLIHELEKMFARNNGIYVKLEEIFSYDVLLLNKLIKGLMSREGMYEIYRKYSQQ